MAENKIRFDIPQGHTFDHLLFQAIRSNSREIFFRRVDEYLQLVQSLSDEDFLGEKFFSIFSNKNNGITKTRCLFVGNVDLKFDNLFIHKTDYAIIDYEWVFSFPIPVKYVIFRALIDFYWKNKSRQLNTLIPLADLLSYVSISPDERIKFIDYELNFQKFTCEENKSGDDALKNGIANLFEIEQSSFFIESASAKVESLETQLQSASAKVESLETQLQSANTQLQSVSAKVESLETQLQSASLTLSNIQSSISWKAVSFARRIFSRYFPWDSVQHRQYCKFKNRLVGLLRKEEENIIEVFLENIEIVSYKNDIYRISGWAAAKSGIDEVVLSVNGEPKARQVCLQKRGDVAVSKGIHALYSGYSFEIDTLKMERGQHSIEVSAHTRDGVRKKATSTLLLKRKTSDLAICTIVSKNYISRARVLIDSFYRFHPEIRCYVLIADTFDFDTQFQNEKFTIVTLDEVNIPALQEMAFQYDVIEFNTAVKPFFLKYLLNEAGFERVIYLDPDICIYNSLDSLFHHLVDSNIILTPHLLKPYEDKHKPNDTDILIAGIYNLGFIGVKKSAETNSFLNWWMKKLQDHCLMQPEKGYHVDQKWIDFVPLFFRGTHVIQDPGYNVAYWNLHERPLSERAGEIFFGDSLLYFFHFSGYVPEMDRLSTHQNRHSLNSKLIRGLVSSYREKLLEFGYKATIGLDYGFEFFNNGIIIPKIARSIYGSLDRQTRDSFGDPFATQNHDSFYAWLRTGIGKKSIPRIWKIIHSRMPYLLYTYPDIEQRDYDGFFHWARSFGVYELKLDRIFLEQSLSPRTSVIKKHYSLKKIRENLFNRLRKNRRLVLIYRQVQDIRKNWRRAYKKKRRACVNVLGYLSGVFGVGESSRALVQSLELLHVPMILNNLTSEYHSETDTTYCGYKKDNPFPINIININADGTNEIFRQKGKNYFKNKYNIGRWAWELELFPEQWESYFRYYNEIWAVSSFCAQAISRRSPIPVISIPNAVSIDERLAIPSKKRFNIEGDCFVFLTIFDYLSYFERKNPLAVVRAFKRAFQNGERVMLIVKTINDRYFQKEAEQLMQECLSDSRITLMKQCLEKRDMLPLMATADCYVSLHRSEGFGLTMAESMLMKKPIIATGYSGNLDFMNASNSYLVQYKRVKIRQSCGPYLEGMEWAEPDTEHAAELMSYVYNNQSDAISVGERASNDIRESFSPKAISKIIFLRLSRI
ncbi:MAG: glycosyltransferase [bacterium]|nr:glycosyltransferase [bacterium]